MLRNLSGGNNRYRGIIPKDALHFSLILAFTIWILYHLTYTYDTNAIVDSYMQVKASHKYKMEQEGSLDFSRDHAVEFETEERKIVDTMHEDRGNSEDVVNENDIDQKGEREKRIKENEARERSFKDDDVSSAVLHVLEELTSEIATDLRNQNMTNDDNEFDFILGNGTINQTDVQKNISYLGSFSDKPDEIEDVEKNENILLVNLNETYIHGEDATDKQNRVKN